MKRWPEITAAEAWAKGMHPGNVGVPPAVCVKEAVSLTSVIYWEYPPEAQREIVAAHEHLLKAFVLVEASERCKHD